MVIIDISVTRKNTSAMVAFMRRGLADRLFWSFAVSLVEAEVVTNPLLQQW